ncbi:MAG: response regulator [Bacteroidota bacterium]
MSNKKSDTRKAKILIIEDSPAVQLLTRKLLTFNDEEDYDIVLANNGEHALNIIKESTPFDLILTDIDMPEMGGEECLKEIRSMSDPLKAKVPVIACTGNAKQRSFQEFKDMGFDDSFIKGDNYRNLMMKIQPILEKIK